MVRCEKCGHKLIAINVRQFLHDGSDSLCAIPIQEYPENAIVLDTDANWCGYGLTHDEQLEDIECPFCRQFPFKHKEIQEQEMLRLVLFKQIDNG